MKYLFIILPLMVVLSAPASASVESWGYPGNIAGSYQARNNLQVAHGFQFLGIRAANSAICEAYALRAGYSRALFGGVVYNAGLFWWDNLYCFGSNLTSNPVPGATPSFIIVPYGHTYEAAVACAETIEWTYKDVRCRTQSGRFKFECRTESTTKTDLARVDCVENLFSTEGASAVSPTDD